MQKILEEEAVTQFLEEGEEVELIGDDDDDDDEDDEEEPDDENDNPEEYDDEEEDDDDESVSVRIGEHENKAVNRFRIFLTVVLVVVALAICVGVYMYFRYQETNDFEKQFWIHSHKVLDAVVSSTTRNLRAMEGFALQITIHALDHEQTWPNVALSDFEARAKITMDLAEAISIIFIPIVTNKTRRGWEQFSVDNQEWLSDGLATQRIVQMDDDEEENLAELIKTYGNDHDFEIPDRIFRINDLGVIESGITVETGPGPYAPLWQFAPAFPIPTLVNYNTLSNPTYYEEIMSLMEMERTILGRAFDYTHNALNSAETRARSAQLNLFLNHRGDATATTTTTTLLSSSSQQQQLQQQQENRQYHGGPVSDLFVPIFDNFSSNRQFVGLLTSNVYWQAYLENLLPENVHGVMVVLENSCGQVFTFQLDADQAQYLGQGDLHETRYNRLEISSGFGRVFLQEEEDENIATTRSGQCIVNIRIYPSRTMEALYRTWRPIIFAAVLVVTFFLTSLLFVWYQKLVDKRQLIVMDAAVRSTTVVQTHFPKNVRDRVFDEQRQKQRNQTRNMFTLDYLRNHPRRRRRRGGRRPQRTSNDMMDNEMSGAFSSSLHRPSRKKIKNNTTKKKPIQTSEAIFGSKPIADLFANTTVMYADMVGFTAWASVREPAQVFVLLESTYHSFDTIAKKLGVFKVETIGDCYVAVTGLPDPRKDHAIVMAKFARQILLKMRDLTLDLETSLGPDTADLGLRIGLHSGPVTAGVIRGDKGRFQLFGDTMNTVAKIENTGQKGKIHLSLETSDLVVAAGKSNWITPREDKVFAKGDDGQPEQQQQTFWLNLNLDNNDTNNAFLKVNQQNSSNADEDAAKLKRLINWNVDVLSRLLKKIVAKRQATVAVTPSRASGSRKLLSSSSPATNNNGATPTTTTPTTSSGSPTNSNSNGNSISLETNPNETILDEVKDSIPLLNMKKSQQRGNVVDPNSVELDPKMITQITSFVTQIASMHRNHNPFHNFEHASHVAMSVSKLLNRIVNNPANQVDDGGGFDATGSSEFLPLQPQVDPVAYGITSDPLTQFACVFSALIHDVDHPGVPNTCLVKENHTLAQKYKQKSMAEQNSVDVAWHVFMDDPYLEDFRNCIHGGDIHELKRFRQIIVNAVMATDIIDKELGVLRKARWEKAFNESNNASTELISDQEEIDRKATIVIEYLIQASDVAHTMQHWHVYQRWNEKLFLEMYQAHIQGRQGTKHPSEFWYQGELAFFDFTIIPLANKLSNCGVFGVSSDEYLNYALANRREWEEKGNQIVSEWEEKIRASQEQNNATPSNRHFEKRGHDHRLGGGNFAGGVNWKTLL